LTNWHKIPLYNLA